MESSTKHRKFLGDSREGRGRDLKVFIVKSTEKKNKKIAAFFFLYRRIDEYLNRKKVIKVTLKTCMQMFRGLT